MTHATQDEVGKQYPAERSADALLAIAANLVGEGQVSRGRWCHAAVERIKALEAIVAKLPHTADGVPVMPGMKVWSARSKTADTEDGAFVIGKIGSGHGWFHDAANKEVGPLYSTPEAARAAALDGRQGEK